MASSSMVAAAFVAVLLVLLPMTSLGSSYTSPLDDFWGDVCDDVECGKGNCTAGLVYPLGFKCECNSGWQRTRDPNDDLTFLPCVIPNCTLNYGCQPAPPPVPEKEIPHNLSFFDPCYWAYCGEGKCTKNKTHTHLCECNTGYFNLLNISAFPCYSECTLGSDCSKLGITVAKSTSTGGSGPSSGSTTGGSSQGTSFVPGKFHWMAVLMVTLGTIVVWK